MTARWKTSTKRNRGERNKNVRIMETSENTQNKMISRALQGKTFLYPIPYPTEIFVPLPYPTLQTFYPNPTLPYEHPTLTLPYPMNILP